MTGLWDFSWNVNSYCNRVPKAKNWSGKKLGNIKSSQFFPLAPSTDLKGRWNVWWEKVKVGEWWEGEQPCVRDRLGTYFSDCHALFSVVLTETQLSAQQAGSGSWLSIHSSTRPFPFFFLLLSFELLLPYPSCSYFCACPSALLTPTSAPVPVFLLPSLLVEGFYSCSPRLLVRRSGRAKPLPGAKNCLQSESEGWVSDISW